MSLYHQAIVRINLETLDHQGQEKITDPLDKRWTEKGSPVASSYSPPPIMFEQAPVEGARIIGSHVRGNELILIYEWKETKPATTRAPPWPGQRY